jgi:two-component system, sensor histidine kinase
MKVLIVDDDRDVADSLAALIRVVLDYDVCVTYDGRDAIETAGQYRPDVVILDVNMPVLDGFQTARELKRDRRLGGTTFIAHTAANDPSLETDASRVGFRHLVTKGGPTSVSKMIDVLSDVHDSRVRRRA